MTTTLSTHTHRPEVQPHPGNDRHRMVVSNGTILAYCTSEPEAEEVKRAFETVLAPRFTRNEAIAIVKAHRATNPEPLYEGRGSDKPYYDGVRAGMRLALEALAAAGVFWDGKNMADRLNAAGIW